MDGGCASGGSDAGNVGNTQESDAGDEEHENVFVGSLCNSGVFDAQMDSTTIQCDINSLYEATINVPDLPPNLAGILNLAPPMDEQLPSSSLQDPVMPLPSQSRIILSALNPV